MATTYHPAAKDFSPYDAAKAGETRGFTAEANFAFVRGAVMRLLATVREIDHEGGDKEAWQAGFEWMADEAGKYGNVEVIE